MLEAQDRAFLAEEKVKQLEAEVEALKRQISVVNSRSQERVVDTSRRNTNTDNIDPLVGKQELVCACIRTRVRRHFCVLMTSQPCRGLTAFSM